MLQHVSELYVFLRLKDILVCLYIQSSGWRSSIFAKLSDSNPILVGSTPHLPRKPVQCLLWPPEGTQGAPGRRAAERLVGGGGIWSPDFCSRNVHPKHKDEREAGFGISHGTVGSASNGKKGGCQGGRGHPCNPSPTHTNRHSPPTASPPAVLQRD